MIMSSLAKEGFSAGQNNVDEVLRHLWLKREYANSKLHLAEQTIKKMSGGDTRLALQVNILFFPVRDYTSTPV